MKFRYNNCLFNHLNIKPNVDNLDLEYRFEKYFPSRFNII